MPNYTFTFKKDDVDVEFKTTDRQLMERQFAVWVCYSSMYEQRKTLAKDLFELGLESKGAKPTTVEEFAAIKQVPEEPIEKPAVIEEQIGEPIGNAVEEMFVEQPLEEKVGESLAEPIFEAPLPPVEQVSSFEPEGNEVFDNAAKFLHTINSIQEDTNADKLDSTTQPEELDFESVLEGQLESSTFVPKNPKDERFLTFIQAKAPQTKQNYLVLTAYYLYMFENCERFSLKQINAKLMHNLSQIVEHEALIDVINQGYVEMVPDLTAQAGTSEYRLSELGENSVLKKD